MPRWHLFTTGRFGAMLLSRLASLGFCPERVYTYTAKRTIGRGLQKGYVPAFEVARRTNLSVLDCENKDLLGVFDGIDVKDTVAICDFGRKIPDDIVKQRDCINIHPSLLPRWRGAAPIHWTLLANDVETGVTVFRMNEKIDSGEILLQRGIFVSPDDNYGTLEEKLVSLAAGILGEYLSTLGTRQLILVPQDEGLATYARKVTKQDMMFSWTDHCSVILNKIRAFSPYWGASAVFKGKRLKVFKARLVDSMDIGNGGYGRIVKIDQWGVHVCVGGGVICINEVQMEGKDKVYAKDFANGYRLKVGDLFY